MYFKFTRPVNHAVARGAYPSNVTHVWFVRKCENPADILKDMPEGSICELTTKPANFDEESGWIFE